MEWMSALKRWIAMLHTSPFSVCGTFAPPAAQRDAGRTRIPRPGNLRRVGADRDPPPPPARWLAAAAALLGILVLAGCGAATPPGAPRDPAAVPAPRPRLPVALRFPEPGAAATVSPAELAPYLEGVASWYGPDFHGKSTASGEPYNQYGLTAAHPVLPIGTRIEVENLANGRKVWVRVNDRGPYAKGRVLDLSRLAAERLDIVRAGTGTVRIAVVQWPESLDPDLGLKAYQQYIVQAGAYPDLESAQALRERVQAALPDAVILLDSAANGYFAVMAGPFDEEAGARDFARRMSERGFANLVRRYRN